MTDTHLTRRRAPSRRSHRSGGYALILFAIILTVMGTLTVVLASAGSDDITSSTRLLWRAQAEGTARAALAQFDALVSDTPGTLTAGRVTYPAGLTNPAGSGVWAELDNGAVEPCGYAAAGDSTSAAASHAFDPATTCYHLTVVPQALPGLSDTPVAALIDVDVRSNCPLGLSGSDPNKLCTYTRFEQEIHQAEFYDYLYYDEFNTIDPALYTNIDPANAARDETNCADTFGTPPGATSPRTFTGADPSNGEYGAYSPHTRPSYCAEVAYQGQNPQAYPATNSGLQDIVDGPVYTDDNYVLTCGDPQFQALVSAAGATPAGPVWVSAATKRGDYCINDTPEFTSASNTTASNGQPGGAPAVSSIAMPQVQTENAEAANLAGVSLRPAGAGPVTLALNASTAAGRPVTTVTATNVYGFSGNTDTFTVASLTRPLVYVQGNADISGVLAGGDTLTVYASGTMTVTGDLCYQAPGATGDTCATMAQLSATPSSINSVLGLVAGGNIVITQATPAPGGAPADRNLDAIMVSIGDSVYVDQWWAQQDSWTILAQAPGGYNGPQLNFYGAIATAYQPVFGGYDELGGAAEKTRGQLVSGYRKNFVFDQRLSASSGGTAGLQPPYLPSPVNPVWLRSGIAQVASKAAGAP